MVTIQFLDGHLAGQSLNASEAGLTPQDILCGIAGYKWRWETDYSQATAEEQSLWSKQDMTMKVVRALAQGLPVRVLGNEYRSESLRGAFQVAAQIEDLILEKGLEPILESDNEHGVIIGAR